MPNLRSIGAVLVAPRFTAAMSVTTIGAIFAGNVIVSVMGKPAYFAIVLCLLGIAASSLAARWREIEWRGLLPISLPPVDGLFFYDAGLAWSNGQSVSFRRPDGYDQDRQRFVLRSYGAGIRLNLFGFALVRWDYAIPLDRPSKKGYWMWTLGQSF